MFQRVIAGYDSRPGADDAVALARTLADAAGASLAVARVFPEVPWLLGERIADLVDRRRRATELGLLDDLAVVADAAGAEGEPVPSGSPARGLTELAEELDADLIVVGSSHRGSVGRVVPGSTAVRLLHGGPCAIAVAPRGFAEGDRRIAVLGVAFDGSPEAGAALDHATWLGERLEGTLRVITVTPPGVEGQHADWYEARLADAVAAIPPSLRPEARAQRGDPGAVILEEADRGIDLLLLGSRGYGPLRRVLLGDVAAGVIDGAPCPVLVLPRGVA